MFHSFQRYFITSFVFFGLKEFLSCYEIWLELKHGNTKKYIYIKTEYINSYKLKLDFARNKMLKTISIISFTSLFLSKKILDEMAMKWFCKKGRILKTITFCYFFKSFFLS